MNSNSLRNSSAFTLRLFLWCGLTIGWLFPRGAIGQVLNDHFEDGFDSATWFVRPWDPAGSTYIDGTQLRVAPYVPPVHDGFLDLTFSTHNPTALTPGDSYYGSEIVSRDRFRPTPAHPLKISTRARAMPPPGHDTVPGGIVMSMFLYDLLGPNSRNEIDVEILTKPQPEGPGFLTNAFLADPFSSAGDVEFNTTDGFDPTDFHKYDIVWATDSIEWYLDDQLIRSETKTVPTTEMALHFNTWAPLFGGFDRALDPSLQPAASAAENVDVIWRLDYARVESLVVGDLTRNGFVDFDDLTIMLSNWNTEGSSRQGNIVDPIQTLVDFDDLTLLLSQWTDSQAGEAPALQRGQHVPEPSSLLMAALGLITLAGVTSAPRQRILRSQASRCPREPRNNCGQ